MNYCSIEEAWGDPLMKENKKKKKQKRLYTSKMPKYIEDTSYLEGGHDQNCSTPYDPNFSTKNKKRFDHSRTNKNIYKKNKTRTPNVQISYDQAAAEYRNFQMENANLKQSQQPSQNEEFLVEGFESSDEMNNIEELERSFNEINDVDESEAEYTNGGVEDTYSPSTNYATDTEAETDFETDIDSDSETDEIVKEAIRENNIEKSNNKANANKIAKANKIANANNELVNINDIDYRLNNLNRNVNTLIKKMNDSDFFDDDSQDNIHDLILFIIFGIFMIFVLDTIYRLGKRN